MVGHIWVYNRIQHVWLLVSYLKVPRSSPIGFPEQTTESENRVITTSSFEQSVSSSGDVSARVALSCGGFHTCGGKRNCPRMF